MSAQVLVGILGVSGLSGIAAAIITAIASRRKLGAEATQIIANAAAGVTQSVTAELHRLEAEMADLRAEHIAALTELRKQHREQLQRIYGDRAQELDNIRNIINLHVAWDMVVIQRVAAVGVELPPPPPLLLS